MHRNLFFLFLLRLEDQGEADADNQCEGGKDEPAGLPVAQQVVTLPGAVVIHYLASHERTDGGTDAIGHHHKQSLR